MLHVGCNDRSEIFTGNPAKAFKLLDLSGPEVPNYMGNICMPIGLQPINNTNILPYRGRHGVTRQLHPFPTEVPASSLARNRRFILARGTRKLIFPAQCMGIVIVLPIKISTTSR